MLALQEGAGLAMADAYAQSTGAPAGQPTRPPARPERWRSTQVARLADASSTATIASAQPADTITAVIPSSDAAPTRSRVWLSVLWAEWRLVHTSGIGDDSTDESLTGCFGRAVGGVTIRVGSR